MQPSTPKNRFEDTYGQVRPTKPHHDNQNASDSAHFSTQEQKTHTANKPTSSRGPWFQLGVTLILIFLGAAALIIGGLFAVASLAVGLVLFLMKRLFMGPSGSAVTRR